MNTAGARSLFAAFAIALAACGVSNVEEAAAPVDPETVRTSIVRLEGEQVVSERFNLSIRNVAGWTSQTPEEVEEIKMDGAKLMNRAPQRADQLGLPDNEKTYHLVTLFQHHKDMNVPDNAYLAIVAEGLGKAPDMESGAAYLENIQSLLSDAPLNYRFEPIDRSVDFDGRKFDVLQTRLASYSSIGIHQDYYAAIHEGFAFVIVASYMTDSQKSDIDKMLDTLDFDWE